MPIICQNLTVFGARQCRLTKDLEIKKNVRSNENWMTINIAFPRLPGMHIWNDSAIDNITENFILKNWRLHRHWCRNTWRQVRVIGDLEPQSLRGKLDCLYDEKVNERTHGSKLDQHIDSWSPTYFYQSLKK